jgi:hypothetical protein
MQSLPESRQQSFEELYGPPENFLEIEVNHPPSYLPCPCCLLACLLATPSPAQPRLAQPIPKPCAQLTHTCRFATR